MPEDMRDIRKNLIAAYDRKATERDGRRIADWKELERRRFLDVLVNEGSSTLVDIGSGPGVHAVYFSSNGIEVTCVDLSPENVNRCREKGLQAYECDVLDLASLGREFDAAFAMNSLLHIPRAQLREGLAAVRKSLKPSGLFYWGQYGGVQQEGVHEEDGYEPKRFFSLLNDEQIREAASLEFNIEEFALVALEEEDPLHYQSLNLRAKDRSVGAAQQLAGADPTCRRA